MGQPRSLRAVAFASAIVVAAAMVILGLHRRRHDAVAHPSSGREHAVIREHHASRSRHQRAEAFEEGERVEDDMRGAVAIPLLQPIADATIGEQRQSLLDDRRARGVAAELLEALATASGNAHGGVQREAIEVTAERAALEGILPRSATRALIVRPLTFAECGPTLEGSCSFRCFRVSALQQLDLAAVSAQGYVFQIEMAFRMVRAGFVVREALIPFIDRQVGNSKMSGKVAREALMLVPKLRFRLKLSKARR